MGAAWYYVVGGKEFGPIGAEEMRRLASAGRITPEHQVRQKGMAGHVPAGRVSGLFLPKSRASSKGKVRLWHYSKNGEQLGPVDSVRLKQLANSGELLPTDLVCSDETSDWVRAETLKGLFDVTASRSTPPPLPPTRKARASSVCQIAESRLPPIGEQLNTTSALQVVSTGGVHRQRLAIAVAAGLGMLATFMPWIHAPIVGSLDGTAGDGWITLALFVPAVVLVLIGKKCAPLVGAARLVAAIPSGVAALIGVSKIVDFQSRKESMAQDSQIGRAMSVSVQIGNGLYLLIAAGVALVFLAWLLAKENSHSQ